jgi:7-cyano-7-deazaguanine synthase in queuosine biosynthesis
MSSVLVIGDGAEHPVSERLSKTVDDTLRISRRGRGRNLHLEITNITHRIVEDLDARAKDLVEIASYIYYADGSIPRWSEKDVFATRWVRDFHFVLPVRNVKFWASQSERLANMLSDLTGDRFSFNFAKASPQPEQLFIEISKDLPAVAGADCVSLFSGGLDSLAGAVNLVSDGRKPLLVSHRSSPKIDSRQKKLVGLMKERMNAWQFPHLNVWVNRKGNPAHEQTQRSRSFLFLALAGAVCNQSKLAEIFVCENGIVTFNIPQSGQNAGTMLSRSTHPRFIKEFQDLLGEVFGRAFSISNPFVFMTKSQVAQTLLGSGCEDLIKASVSCAHTQQATTLHPHCGTCSQCVDRRFALADRSLYRFDSLESYEKDIFVDELKEGEERTHAENYVRSALKIEPMTDASFFSTYTELLDSLPWLAEGTEVIATKIFDLFKRHSREVLSVVKDKWTEYGDQYIRKQLPKHCLISMIARQDHLRDPVDLYATKLGELIEKSLRLAFQSRRPAREKDVQDQIQATLAAAGERLRRENPHMYFSVVQTKPDFSDKYNRLFIEAKYMDRKEELNGIVKDMTSRVVVYNDQGACVLFVVYDNANVIAVDDDFATDFVKHDGIFVKIVR